MNRLAPLALLILTACGPRACQHAGPVDIVVCDPSERQARADIIVRCVEAANPKSDEEPEDWLPLCERMAQETFCTKKPGFRWFRQLRPKSPELPCNKAGHPEEILACGGLGRE